MMHLKNKYFIIVYILISSLFSCSSTTPSGKLNLLSDYIGYDLRKLDSESIINFKNIVNSRIPANESPFRGEPWSVWKNNNLKGDSRLLVFSVSPLKSIPGNAYVNIWLFDKEYNYIDFIRFPTGNRLNIYRVILRKTSFSPPLIQIDMTTFSTKQVVLRQYYANINDRIALVRVEDNNGNIKRLSYAWGQEFGPTSPKRTIDEWKLALESDDPLIVMESLIWLSGIHADLSKMKTEMPYEKTEDVKLYESFYQTEFVQRNLNRLTNSDIKWVKEAAILAQNKKSDWIIDK